MLLCPWCSAHWLIDFSNKFPYRVVYEEMVTCRSLVVATLSNKADIVMIYKLRENGRARSSISLHS